ncbi:hypothetical protein H0A71_12925 [Alcaligenaceae bacterium]|nr:hypothetical protein [Alcaligenaceae bacterium]
MKPLSRYARQLHQRRISAFFLLKHDTGRSDRQIEITTFSPHEDRPRTLREMFPDAEIDPDEQD